MSEGNTEARVERERATGPARSQTPCMYRTSLRENREIHGSPVADGATGRIGKAGGRTPMMDDLWKSDRLVVPAKSPNKTDMDVAEAVEGRVQIQCRRHWIVTV